MKAILILSLVSAANLTSAPVVIAGKNHKKYQYCLQEVYGQCIHQ